MSEDALSILMLTKYARRGASSRYRSLQYIPVLEEAGFQCTVRPFFDDAYLEALYDTGRHPLGATARAYIRRMKDLRRAHGHDLIFFEKELFPYLPAGLERLLAGFDVGYVVDIDDAVFHNYDRSRNPAVRAFLEDKIGRLMRDAALVTAGNEYLANYARAAGAPRVEVVPTVVDLDDYPGPTDEVPAERGNDEVFTIGWIGSPTTAPYLDLVRNALAEVCAAGNCRVRLIGSGEFDLVGVPTEHRKWSEGTEVDNLRGIDVGIMPLPDTPWERGKCGFKLIQYMAMGKPVIASPVGVNSEIVEPGVNGFLADTTEAWIEAIESLRDPKLRVELGRAGRAKVEATYSLDVTVPRVADLLREAATAG